MTNPKTIAVIGSGISGIATAWLLSKKYDVTLYEKNDYLGGHTNTRGAAYGDTTVWADTGFMVFNHHTYHNLVPLLNHFHIDTVETEMSLGVSLRNGEFEFSADEIFAQKKNLLSPTFWRMFIDIIRFNQRAQAVVEAHDDEFALGELLSELHMSSAFREKYLLPMAGAIWSTSGSNILEYPAKHFIAFCKNHGLLTPTSYNPFRWQEGRVTWYTIKGGSRVYLEKIKADMQAEILTGVGVTKITRSGDGVTLADMLGNSRSYDAVVCATHPDQALAMLADPTENEKTALGTFVYSKHETIMHRDSSFMMRHVTQWPSWTYAEPEEGKVELSYYMNRLQHIDPATPVFVTLSPSRKIADADIFYKTTYEHPRFSVATRGAQEMVRTMQGEGNTWYAGAWLGHGFHEDGLRSALEVVNALGVFAPWQRGEDKSGK